MASSVEQLSRERSAHTALIAAGFVGLGLPAGVLGAAWPSIEEDLHRATTDLTVALVCFGAGYFLCGAAAGFVRRHVGGSALLVGSAALLAGGLAVSAAAPSWPVLVIGSGLLGSGGGALDTGLNVAAALHSGARTINLLHAFFAAGAAAGPLVLAATLAAGGSWRVAYLVLLAADAALAIAFVRHRVVLAGHAGAAPRPADVVAPRRRRHSRAIIAAIVALAIVYVGSEVSAGQWGPSLVRERGASPATAGVWIAGFWAGLGGGRLLAAYVAGWLRATALLGASLGVLLGGAVVLWWAPLVVVGNLGFVVLGFGMAAVFPTVVALTPSWVGTEQAPIAIGMQIAGSAIGGLGFPVLIGRLARASGLEVVGPVITVGALLLIVVVFALQRLAA